MVAVAIRAIGLWWINGARIVYVVDEETRFGFAYGTLPGHVERGEERFTVELGDDGTVSYEILAFSRLRRQDDDHRREAGRPSSAWVRGPRPRRPGSWRRAGPSPGVLHLRLAAAPAGPAIAPWVRILWAAAGLSLLAGMVLAALYGSRFFLPAEWNRWLHVGWMQATHGLINAVGFGLGGVLAWRRAEGGTGPGRGAVVSASAQAEAS